MIHWLKRPGISIAFWDLEHETEDPEGIVQACPDLDGQAHTLCVLPWTFSKYWLKGSPQGSPQGNPQGNPQGSPQEQYYAFYLIDKHAQSKVPQAGADVLSRATTLAISPRAGINEQVLEAWIDKTSEASLDAQTIVSSLCALVKTHGGRVCDLRCPLTLNSVEIPKPWGAEVWHSGIEERGVSGVDALEGTLSLPLVLAAAPRCLLGTQQASNPILLKELVPHSDKFYGDLYFELHERKQEVYVVTQVDKQAWPDGCGKIRLGVSDTKRAQYPSDEAFRADYLVCLKHYEQIRERVEAALEHKRKDDILPDVALLRQWRTELPAKLVEEESQAKVAVEEFSQLQSLRLGDVIKIPLHVPHALQHGVRVVEFQTPVYERKIISFGQKVLTQHGWDVEAAIALMQLDTPEDAITRGDDMHSGRIASFEDFVVYGMVVKGASQLADVYGTHGYALAITIGGDVCVLVGCEQQRYKSGQAFFIPASTAADISIRSESNQPVRLLLAVPTQQEEVTR